MTIKANATGTGSSAANASALIGGLNSTTVPGGSGQSDATALGRSSNVWLKSGTGGVCLYPALNTTAPKFAPGDWCNIINQSGGSINVYPPTGGTIQGGSANAAYAVGNNLECKFTSLDGTNFSANKSA